MGQAELGTHAHSVACVIPVRNAEAYIAEAIRSVLAQTVAIDEIIVVDDGSTDESARIVKTEFPQVRYLYQDHAGACRARNKGIGACQQEFVALLDADDLWEPSKLAAQLALFQARPRLAACLTRMQNFWMAEVAEEQSSAAGASLSAPQPGAASTLVMRAAAIEEIGLLNERLRHRDIQEWLVRADGLGWETHTLEEVLVRRRIHAANESRARSRPDSLEFLEIAQAAIAARRNNPRG